MKNLKRLLFAKKLAFLLFLIAFSSIATAQVRINSTNYPSLREAFNGINAGHYTGQNIVVEITGNTTETSKSEITLTTPSYQSITIRPSGTGTRTILYNSSLIDNGSISFNRAHNITIDGMDQLTIAATDDRSSLVFDSSNDVVVKNCKIRGGGIAGVLLITGSGLSNNILIKDCEFAPYNGENYPETLIMVQGNGGRPTNISIENNLIHDFIAPNGFATGILITKVAYVAIKQNRIYQTFTHAGKNLRGIYLDDINTGSGTTDCEVSGNLIGGVGYPVGSIISPFQESAASYVGISYFGQLAPFNVNITGNTIGDINVRGIDTATSTNHYFAAIDINDGYATITNNTIGSALSTGVIKDYSYNTGSTSVLGISTTNMGKLTISNNTIYGIEAYTPATSIPVELYGICVGRSIDGNANPQTVNCDGNTVGSDLDNSLRNDSQNSSSTLIGISVKDQRGTINSNTVKNLIGYGAVGGVVGIERILFASNSSKALSGNTIFKLTNANTSGVTEVIGIKQIKTASGNGTDEIERNFIYNLNSASTNAAAQVIGISIFQQPSRLLNNMVAITSNMSAAKITGITSDFNSDITIAGQVENNSVYIGGTQTIGSAASCAFYQTSNSIMPNKVYNNIFVNTRTNSGSGTGTHTATFISAGSTDIKANLYTDPHFINPLATTPNLHIDPSVPTMAEAKGYTNAGFHPTLDFDSQTRSGLTPVDIGADAGNFIALMPPVISSVSAVALCANSTFEITGTGLATVTEVKIGSTLMTISGISETSLTIDTGGAALTGSLIVTNPAGTATHATTINIYSPPVITAQPNAVTACGTTAVSFSVTATNAVTYQWRRNGSNLVNDAVYSNVNTTTLNISTAGSVPYGSTFDVVITGTANACTIVSSGATLFTNITPLPIISASGATTFCQGNSVTLSTNYNGPAVQHNGGSYFNFQGHGFYDFTVEYWIKTSQTGSTGSQWYNGQGIVDAKMSSLPSQCEFGTSLVGNKLAFGIGGFNTFGTYSPFTVTSATSVNSGQWVHVAVTRKESTGELRVYINGVLDASGFTVLRGAIITPNFRVGALQTGGNNFIGAIDDIRVWSYVRTQGQILSGMSHSYLSGTGGLVDNFTMNENSGSSTINLGTGVTSTFVNNPSWTSRSTTSNYTAYTWSNGAHTPTINVTASGNYSVQVTDFNGCTGSWIPVAVNVQSINVSPSVTVCQGSPTTLAASGAVSYSWTPGTGLNTTVGSLVIATPAATTTYTVTGTMASGCQTSKQLTVTVNPPVTISASQLNILAGGNATLTASGGSGYTWSPATGLNTTSGASVIATPAITTTYTVTSSVCSATVTITVLPPVSYQIDNALNFDGVDDYVSIPVQTGTVSGSFTVEAWVKPMHATKTMHIFSSRNGQDYGFDIQISNGNLIHGDIGNGSSWITTAANATFNYQVNKWMHIIYVVSPTNYKIFVNGNLVGSAPLNGTPLLYSPARSITIGKSTTENTFFQGTLDEIRIYNTNLSDAQTYMEFLGNYQGSGVLAYYTCNEGIAGGNNGGINKLVDWNTANNFHGTLNNFALNGATSNWVSGKPLDSTVDLNLLIQGYYIGDGMMAPVKYNQDYVSDPSIVEELTVSLYTADTYQLVDTTTATLYTNGTVNCKFETGPIGSFYIAVKGRNIVQTWSATPIDVNQINPAFYDFTSSISKAYGNNEVLMEGYLAAFYSGDINQDDIIDPSDYSQWELDFNNFSFGAFATDLNGDGIVDPSDYSIWELNFNKFIFAFYPF